jgi:ankyrin repeat protein
MVNLITSSCSLCVSHLLSRHQLIAVIRALLGSDKKLDVNAPIHDNTTPLCIAAQNGHADAIRALLESGKQLDMARAGASGATPLSAAAYFGNELAVEALLEAGASTGKAVNLGYSPIELARGQGHSRVVEIFLHYSSRAEL